MFIRDTRYKSLLENFLIAGVSSVLITRAFLILAGFPQLNPGGLHIAHMLWGGLFMLAALYILLSSNHPNIKYSTSILGGVGFGLFIDELGKFITKDHNYFYKPTYAIIYVIFIMLFLSLRLLVKKGFTKEEILASEYDKKKLELFPPAPYTIEFSLHEIAQKYYSFIVKQPKFITFIFIFIVIKIIIGFMTTVYLAVGGIFTIYNNHHLDFFDLFSVFGNLISTVLSIYGIRELRKSKKNAYIYLQQALVYTILIDQVFTFYSSQFGAVILLFFNLFFLAVINTMISQEEKKSLSSSQQLQSN